jgi:hypothetical protein
VTVTDRIPLALTIACVAGSIWCCVGARRYAQQTRASARRARAASRRARGTLAEIQLGQLKRAASVQRIDSRVAADQMKEQ